MMKKTYTNLLERKILYYEINRLDAANNVVPFYEIDCFMNYIINNNYYFYYDDKRSSKWYSIEKINIINDNEYEIIFINCKYNHRPNYINVVTKEERESQKEKDEGDKEITHAYIKENRLLLESRRSGTTAYIISRLFNIILSQIDELNTDDGEKIVLSQILDNDFLDIINKSKRIKNIRYKVSSSLQGSQFFNYGQDENIEEEYEIKIKAKRKKTFNKNKFIEWLISNVVSKKNIEKIIVDLIDENYNKKVINNEEFGKSTYVNVEKNDKGEVISEDIFSKMKDL